jgi:hypothetical protein
VLGGTPFGGKYFADRSRVVGVRAQTVDGLGWQAQQFTGPDALAASRYRFGITSIQDHGRQPT